MATKSSASELTRLINQLRTERQHHLDSISEIDQTFKEFGISHGEGGAIKKGATKPAKKGKRGRPAATATADSSAKKGPAKATAKKGKRGKKGKAKAKSAGGGAGKPKSPWGSKFPITGDELILGFVKEKGGATTEEIRKHWLTSGRKGKAENNLTTLVKTNKLKRTKLEGKPGSTYSIP